jgi:tRNA1Val (adenine37-N6)-methyltransferase
MGRPYFQFKEFNVRQPSAAMKVTTDACLFGAWIANLGHPESIFSALDIGTGTGLLSLMLAQQINCSIDALDIENSAIEDARINFSNSPWRSRISLIHDDFNTWIPPNRYNFIFSNPPFYEKDLLSVKPERSNALHDTSLSLRQIFARLPEIITAEGNVALLLPGRRLNEITKLLKADKWHIQRFTSVYQKQNCPLFRFFVVVGKNYIQCREESITIYETNGGYTNQFVSLLKPYYLNL